MADPSENEPPKRRGPQPASVDLTAFVCPHCGTHTTQHWYELFASRQDKGQTPFILRPDFEAFVRQSPDMSETEKEELIGVRPV